MNSPPRDLIGYGRDSSPVEWPEGALLALNFALNYEEGSERSFAFGDRSNDILGEVNRALDAEYRDLATESVYEYGSRAGAHRLFRLFQQQGIRCTVFAAAVALERNPEVCAWIRDFGHEACGHGYRWSEDWKVSRAEEAERIRRAVASIAETCGERPVGWYNRWMPSVHTREILVEEGGFIYDSNAYNDDLPYYVQVLGSQHLVVPYSLTYNDVRYVTGGVSSPTDFVDYCTRAIDFLLDEARTRPKMLSIGLHPRWSGQAGRASAVKDVIDYARRSGGVWFATRREIAQWWLEKYPPSTS